MSKILPIYFVIILNILNNSRCLLTSSDFYWLYTDFLLTLYWFLLTFYWLSTDFLLTFYWLYTDFLLTFYWLFTDFYWLLYWLSTDFLLTFYWLCTDTLLISTDSLLTFFWHLLTLCWLSSDFFWLSTFNLLLLTFYCPPVHPPGKSSESKTLFIPKCLNQSGAIGNPSRSQVHLIFCFLDVKHDFVWINHVWQKLHSFLKISTEYITCDIVQLTSGNLSR